MSKTYYNLTNNYGYSEKENDIFGMFQLGTILSVNRTGIGTANDLWQLNLGVLYNRIAVEQRSLGVTIRAKGSTILGPEAGRAVLDNFYFNAEGGITFAGVVNVYYGRNIVENPVPGLIIPNQYVGISLSLNVSYFKFGLQGM